MIMSDVNADTSMFMVNDAVNLPSVDRIGSKDNWNLRIPQIGDELRSIKFTGKFLGLGSSRRAFHSGHAGVYANAALKERCSACRWFEVRIFKNNEGWYLVYRLGRTSVPGEDNRISYEWVPSSYEVVEVLTSRYHANGRTVTELTGPAARVLAQAAAYDDDLRDAYVDRATA